MPLVKVNELLHHATENGYGVAAVNVFNYETIKWWLRRPIGSEFR